jgi:hypothetical protein
MVPDQLERYRVAVDEDRSGSKLAGLVAKARADGLEVTGHWVLDQSRTHWQRPVTATTRSDGAPDCVSSCGEGS